ncbi:hypothetical protein ASPFODRAFT_621696 [Aspergillus luchuensis CBS 106.47]|uniref:Uncharacterized protein n=1 Tax=Aspergillus luchuensis (strain CBS 106.47) TaxID=1137211 RepID=A0A1M3TFT3_ASPLC|nr:hypothetical protein ASPFODRAFT_621696 [Aspergillus luchuensis CBS 106.47]
MATTKLRNWLKCSFLLHSRWSVPLRLSAPTSAAVPGFIRPSFYSRSHSWCSVWADGSVPAVNFRPAPIQNPPSSLLFLSLLQTHTPLSFSLFFLPPPPLPETLTPRQSVCDRALCVYSLYPPPPNRHYH